MYLYTGSGTRLNMATQSDLANIDVSEKRIPWDTVIHRGWISGAKENTLPAMYLVKEHGYNWAECDVRFSSEGVPVLAHNATLVSEDSATTLTVASSTVEQLKSIVLQTHATFGEIRMPTLAEVLDMARLNNIGILIDFKAGNVENAKTVAEVVLSSGWSDHVVYMPMSVANAQAIQTIDKNASFDFVSSVTAAGSLPDLAQYTALLTGANTVGFDFEAATTDANGGMDTALYDAVRAAGLSISFWNVRSSAYKTYMDAGPLRITKQNTADALDLDTLYLESKSWWQ